MLATHDPRLIEITTSLALLTGRAPDSFEYQMLYGIRPAEQRRLAGTGRGRSACGAARVLLPGLEGFVIEPGAIDDRPGCSNALCSNLRRHACDQRAAPAAS
jgi:hypothetical protein